MTAELARALVGRPPKEDGGCEVAIDRTELDWATGLPQLSIRGALLQREQRRVSSRLAALPQELLDRAAAALASQWALPAEPVEGLELRVTAPGSAQTCRLVFCQRVIRIGSSQDDQLFLPELGVRGWRWEIRRGLVGTRLVVCRRNDGLGSEGSDGGGTTRTHLNGDSVEADATQQLAPGDRIEIGDYLIEIGQPRMVPAPEDSRLEIVQSMAFLEGPPFGLLGSDTSLWLRLSMEEWSGFVRVPGTWPAYAYRSLGYAEPPRSGDPVPSEVDRAITSFLFERAALRFVEGLEVEGIGADGVRGLGSACPSFGPLLTRREVESLVADSQRGSRWHGAEMRLVLAGEPRRFEVVWPVGDEAVGQAARIGSGRPGALGMGMEGAEHEVRVVAAEVTLDACTLSGLRRGDVVLPDRWLSTVEVDTELEPEGGAGSIDLLAPGLEVELRLQRLWRRARVMPAASQEGRSVFELELSTDQWREPRRGDAMPMENRSVARDLHLFPEAEGPDAAEDRRVRLPEQLEVEITFELARESLPLSELLDWQSGELLQLDRAAADPLRIVLQQPGSRQRWLGTGRVVLIEERLGVQIDEWWVCDEE